jgi:hypothetical protein
VVLAYLLGRRVAGGALLGGIVATSYAMSMMRMLEGGFPRSFSLVVLMLGVWAVVARKTVWLGAAFLMAALFYPPTLVNLGLLAGVVWGVRIRRERSLPTGWPAALALAGVAAAISVANYARPLPPNVGPKVTAAEARAMPEFRHYGRSNFFFDDPVEFYIHHNRSGLGIQPPQLVGEVAAVALAAVLFRRAVPLEVWALAGSALGAFGMAHLTLFVLHYPNRYVRYAIPLFLMLWLAAIFPRAVAAVRCFHHGAFILDFLGRPHILAPMAALVLAIFSVHAVVRIRTELSRRPLPGQEETYAFLETLPKKTLVSAHPFDADFIPLRARRSVLASVETSLPYYRGYYRAVAERIEAELAACYASDWADVDALYERYGAKVFMVNRNRYEGPERNYFAPFGDRNAERIQRRLREGFVLLHPPVERVLFESAGFAVVRLGPQQYTPAGDPFLENQREEENGSS